jgi:hypothetical protein
MKKPFYKAVLAPNIGNPTLGRREGDDENCLRAERETKFWEVRWEFLWHLWICGVDDLAVGNQSCCRGTGPTTTSRICYVVREKRHLELGRGRVVRHWTRLRLCGSNQSPSLPSFNNAYDL